MSRPPNPSQETSHRVGGHCLCLHAQRAARALARRFDDAFRPLDLTNGQFSLMMFLNRAEPATYGAAAAMLSADRTTLTAALKPLQRRGLVRVAVDRQDRRSRRLILTGKGKALLASAVPVWRQVHADLDRVLEDGDRLRSELRALSFAAELAG